MSTNGDNFRTAIRGFSAVVDSVGDWSVPSPCDEWTAREVVGHVIGGLQVISGVQTGKTSERRDPSANAGDDPAEVFRQERDLALDALTEANVAESVESPIGAMPLDQMMGMFLIVDVLIHT